MEHSREILYLVFAAFAGLLGHLMRKVRAKEKISWFVATLEALASGFVGIMSLLFCSVMNLNEAWTGLVVGVMGWLGANATMSILELAIYRRLGLNKTSVSGEEYEVDFEDIRNKLSDLDRR